jgi:hypothetical protein
MSEIAEQAQEKAHEKAEQAEGLVRDQIDERSTQAGQRISDTAGDLRSVGEELRNQGKETPAKLADQAADRTERLGSYLTESDSDRLLSDLEDFGRRQPLAVLAGGLVVGLAAARFLKASSRERYQRSQASEPTRELATPAGTVPTAAPSTAPLGQPEPVAAGR